jgi:hypothetical protein
MHDRPTVTELIDAVRTFLETDVVPALDGTKKFHARVAANVLAITSRQIALEDQQSKEEWRRLDALLGRQPVPRDTQALKEALRDRTQALCDVIRRGDADTGDTRRRVLAHVRATVREKLAVANPKLLR